MGNAGRFHHAAAVASALFLSQPALGADGDQFDVVCTKDGKQGSRLSIDLVAGEWCSGDCTEINKIAEVTSSKILLKNERATHLRGTTDIQELNRITGELVSVYKSAGVTFWDLTEQCERRPFTGLARSPRKF